MRFEEALKVMREGKQASLDGCLYKIDEDGDLVVEELQDPVFEFYTWSVAHLYSCDILSEKWEVVDDTL